MKYAVVHKLTNKPIRDTRAPFAVIEFDSETEAQKLVDLKLKVMGANFYKIIKVGAE